MVKEGKRFFLYVTSFFWVSAHKLALASQDHYDHEKQQGDTMEDIAVILGLCTLLLLSTTFLLGKFMPKNRQKFFKLHKTSATLTLISALCHAVFVFFFH